MDRISYLQKTLLDSGWEVIEKNEGNEYDITERWTVRRSDGKEFVLNLEGMDELNVLPVHRSYGVRVQGFEHLGEYISGKRIPREKRMDDFARKLTMLANGYGE